GAPDVIGAASRGPFPVPFSAPTAIVSGRGWSVDLAGVEATSGGRMLALVGPARPRLVLLSGGGWHRAAGRPRPRPTTRRGACTGFDAVAPRPCRAPCDGTPRSR